MSVVHDLILDGGIVFTGRVGEAEIEALFEAASERCLTEADGRCVYLSDCLDHLDRYRDHIPEPPEVREHLAADQLGDWQAVVRATAYVAVREHLGQQVSRDIDALRKALDEATGRSYNVVAVHSGCPYGWQPHIRETNWRTGVLFNWKRERSDLQVSALAVAVSGCDHLWLQLAR